ncbi:ATP-binding protein [bacterium]|nr:ATP-binding protein [bacterium]
MIPKSIDDSKKSDIESLISNQIQESRTIEYKESLPGNSDPDKREFLADISSFANAAGGDLLYGITAMNGLPQQANGLGSNIDAEMLRLENLIRDGVAPRITGIRIVPIAGFPKGPVLLLRILKSWSSPHMVILKNQSKFFIRNSAGKCQMDVSEIRMSFALSEALPDRIRRFRDDRLAKIIAGETPVPMSNSAKLILHILPLISFSTDFKLDISVLPSNKINLGPIGPGGWNGRFNIDGFLTYSGTSTADESKSYCQTFRSGHIETVCAKIICGNKKIIPIENQVIEAISRYLKVLRILDVSYPMLVLVSMVGVLGADMSSDGLLYDEGEPIDRDVLILPDIMLEETVSDENKNDVAQILRPMFDALWNACGYKKSMHYDNQGNWNSQG